MTIPSDFLLIAGNKMDRDDKEVPSHVGQAFADKNSMFFIEVSAKEADNVEKLFFNIAADLRDQAKAKEPSRYDNDTQKLSSENSRTDKCPC